MRQRKLTKEERKNRKPAPTKERPLTKEDLEALIRHFETKQNLP